MEQGGLMDGKLPQALGGDLHAWRGGSGVLQPPEVTLGAPLWPASSLTYN